MSTPTGAVISFGGASVPAGWLMCDGAPVSRTTYASLFAILGTVYGPGDGSTTFNLPNLVDRTVVGVGDAPAQLATVLGDAGGADDHTLTATELPPHKHKNAYGSSNRNPPPGGGSANRRTGTMPAAGGGTAHTNVQPYLALKYCIKT